jgi:hypothetical protein
MSFVSDAPLDLLGPGGGAANPLASTSSGGSSPFSLGTVGTAAAGGAGLAGLFLSGSNELVPQFQQLEAQVPGLESEASTLEGEGQTFTTQGTQTLNNAAAGVLTPQQQAQLSVFQSGLTNTADQEYASMGRNPNQDTSFISTQADIDTKVNAMAQQQIQSSIALGLAQVGAGNTATGQGLGFQNAADSALIAAGNAQVAADTQYSNALSGAFSAIGTILGGGIGAAVGGPAGAVAGASIGKAV